MNKRLHNEMKIVTAQKGDAERIAVIIRGANRDVAELFGITKEKSPTHPSFCTTSWVTADFGRGVIYFLHQDGDIHTGCVAFEQPDPDTAYLNRLAVLPEYRRQGIGSALVEHVIAYSRSKYVRIVSIGIIAAHEKLKAWYVDQGFIEKATIKIAHLPFDVTYLHFEL